MPMAHDGRDFLLRRHGLNLERAHEVVAGSRQKLELILFGAAALARRRARLWASGRRFMK